MYNYSNVDEVLVFYSFLYALIFLYWTEERSHLLFLTSNLSEILQLLTHPAGEYRVIIMCIWSHITCTLDHGLNSGLTAFHLSTERTG